MRWPRCWSPSPTCWISTRSSSPAPAIGAAGQIYADAAADQLRTSTFAREVHTTRISLSTMGADAAALGAASLVLHSHLTPGAR